MLFCLVLLFSFFVPLITSKATFTLPYRSWTSWDLSAVTNSETRGYGHEFLTEYNVIAQSDALAASPLQQIWDKVSHLTLHLLHNSSSSIHYHQRQMTTQKSKNSSNSNQIFLSLKQTLSYTFNHTLSSCVFLKSL
jgi:hypothetical protein